MRPWPGSKPNRHCVVTFSGVVPANQTEESEVRELSGRGPELVPEPSFACKCDAKKPLTKGVPQLISGLLSGSSWTSLSLVWFAGTTPEKNCNVNVCAASTKQAAREPQSEVTADLMPPPPPQKSTKFGIFASFPRKLYKQGPKPPKIQ